MIILTALAIFLSLSLVFCWNLRRDFTPNTHNQNDLQYLKNSYAQLLREIQAKIWHDQDAKKLEQDLARQILEYQATPVNFTQFSPKKQKFLMILLIILMPIIGGVAYISIGSPLLSPMTKSEFSDYYFEEAIANLRFGQYQQSLDFLEKYHDLVGDNLEYTILLIENAIKMQDTAKVQEIFNNASHEVQANLDFQLFRLKISLQIGAPKNITNQIIDEIQPLIPENPQGDALRSQLQGLKK